METRGMGGEGGRRACAGAAPVPRLAQPRRRRRRHATAAARDTPGKGNGRRRAHTVPAYKGLPEDVSRLPLPVDCGWGSTLETDVQLISSNMSWVRLTEIKHRSTSK